MTTHHTRRSPEIALGLMSASLPHTSPSYCGLEQGALRPSSSAWLTSLQLVHGRASSPRHAPPRAISWSFG
jgi:hypothetical protein